MNELKILSGIVAIMLMAFDYLQTMVIARNPDLFWENNPLLGKHPSPMRVRIYFCFVSMLGGLLFAANKHGMIPDLSFWIVMAITIVAEVICIVNNHKIGIRVQ